MRTRVNNGAETMSMMDWDAAWRCLADPIIRVGGSRNGWHYCGAPDIMTCVKVNSDTCCLKTTPPLPSQCVHRGWDWKRRCLICICLRSIDQSHVRPALDGCDRVLVQIKFRKIERDGESNPVRRRDGVFGDGEREKNGSVALWWMDQQRNADLTPMSFLPTQWPFVFFFHHSLPGLMWLSWSAWPERAWHCTILHS